MRKALYRQGYHLAVYALLGAALFSVAQQFPGSLNRLWGFSAFQWVLFSWALAGCHQFWIAFFWRRQLYVKQTKEGTRSITFRLYRVGFVLFGAGRFLALIPASLATRHSLPMPPVLSVGLIVFTTPFILWGMYSVLFYFGITRAFGADHFDPDFRGGSLEKRGIFRYVPNSMYTVVLTVLYHPGFLWQSKLGLILAAAHHAFVWTHFFCTEKPDMREIYGTPLSPSKVQD